MKKAIALLLALALVGGAVFAQDAAPSLTFSGNIWAGLMYDMQGDADATLSWNRGSGSYAGWAGTNFRTRVNAKYTNGDAGAFVRFQSTNFEDWNPTQAYGWAQFLDGMVKFNVGKLGDYTWATSGNDFGNFDGQVGTQLLVMPIDGLSFGAFLPTPSVMNTPTVAEEAFGALKLGMSYSIPEMAVIKAGYSMGELAAGVVADNTGSFYFGVNVSAVENLTAIIDGKLSNMGDDVNGSTYIYEEFAYAMGALTPGLWAEQTILPTDGSEIEMTFAPNVEYALDPFTLGAEFAYTLNAGNAADKSAWAAHAYGVVPVSNSKVQLGLRLAGIGGDANADAVVDAAKNTRIYAAWSFTF